MKKKIKISDLLAFLKMSIFDYVTVYAPPHPLGDRALLIGGKSRDQRLSTLISADSVAPNT